MRSCFSISVMCVFRDCLLVTAVSLIMGYSFCSTSGVFCSLCDTNVGQMIEATILVDQGEYKISEFPLFGLWHVIRLFTT